jgi:hypothetical protein
MATGQLVRKAVSLVEVDQVGSDDVTLAYQILRNRLDR